MLNDLIINKLKETVNLQDVIKTDELYIINKGIENIIILVEILYLLQEIYIKDNYHHEALIMSQVSRLMN